MTSSSSPPPSFSSVPAASAVSLTTATPANVTSMPLSAGSYLVWGQLNATLTGATLTALVASLSLTSGALAAQNGQTSNNGVRLFPEPIAQQVTCLTTATGTSSIDVGVTLLTVPPGVTATLYLVGQAAFSAGSVAAYGSLFALPIPN